jgi:hypothetical protein
MLAGWYEKSGLAEKVIEVGVMEMPRAKPGEVLMTSSLDGLFAAGALRISTGGSCNLC